VISLLAGLRKHRPTHTIEASAVPGRPVLRQLNKTNHLQHFLQAIALRSLSKAAAPLATVLRSIVPTSPRSRPPRRFGHHGLGLSGQIPAPLPRRRSNRRNPLCERARTAMSSTVSRQASRPHPAVRGPATLPLSSRYALRVLRSHQGVDNGLCRCGLRVAPLTVEKTENWTPRWFHATQRVAALHTPCRKGAGERDGLPSPFLLVPETRSATITGHSRRERPCRPAGPSEGSFPASVARRCPLSCHRGTALLSQHPASASAAPAAAPHLVLILKPRIAPPYALRRARVANCLTVLFPVSPCG
jgi:hypothetical protein